MNSFAIYRLPHATSCTLIEQTKGQPEELQSCAELNGREGFVVAPFQITTATPLLLIRPDRMERLSLEDQEVPSTGMSHSDSKNEDLYEKERRQYAATFARFHAELASHSTYSQSAATNRYQKLVLSRCFPIENNGSTPPMQLFFRACKLYPRLFISLVSTPQSGTWLAATPEILLEGQADQWRTIALAGTMKLEGENLNGEGESVTWSTKNIQEQRYVATYLAEQLKPFVSQVEETGPRTVRAANLVHLRSDFTFTLYNNTRVGDLLQALHPTPAVCGLPKQQAFDFILRNEHTPRLYYSGFMGPLSVEHADSSLFTLHSSLKSTHLYVSLRCMQICQHEYRLYAGGGLLKDSQEEQEWQETEAKMETMRQLITN